MADIDNYCTFFQMFYYANFVKRIEGGAKIYKCCDVIRIWRQGKYFLLLHVVFQEITVSSHNGKMASVERVKFLCFVIQ